MTKLPFTIAVDFDNTIARSIWPDIKGLMPGAKEAIQQLHKEGIKIIVWTCREDESLQDAVSFLQANDIPFDHINENCPLRTALYKSDSRKIGADLYVDDKGTEGIVPWPRVVQQAKCLRLLHEEGLGIGYDVRLISMPDMHGMIVGVQSLFFRGTKPTAYVKIRNADGIDATFPLEAVEKYG